MTNEIKEIFSKYGKSNYNDNYCLEFETYLIELKELKILYDYIANLQEENERLERKLEVMEHNYNLLVRCIKNGESMTQKYENGLTYQDYKSRINKAAEYIDEHKRNVYDTFGEGIVFGEMGGIKEILNILQGEGK